MDEIAFGTDGWRATREEITPERLHAVAQAVVDVLADRDLAGEPVAVGYDARRDARADAEELARVLAAGGHDVVLAERDAPTPAVAHAVVDRGLAGAMMVTASHNPPEYGGVKFVPWDGAPALPAVTDAVEAALREPDPLPPSEHGSIREVDLVAPHVEAVLDRLDPNLSGLTVAYDAMHGTGRGATDAALERAGAEVRRLRCERDPDFGGRSPNPTPDRLDELVAAVERGDADLGIANDGDADRVAVVTPEGPLDANRLFAVFYEFLLDDDAGPAVRTVSTTFLIDRIAAAHGERTAETPVGFKWVAEAMAEHDALIGGEESGGFTIRDHVRLKDGVLAGLLAAAAAVEHPLQERIEALLAEHGEIYQDRVSVDCPDDRKAAVVEAIATDRPDAVLGVEVEDVNPADGVKLLLEDGSWLLVRPSGTEPKVRVYAEAASAARVADLLDAGRELVEAHV